MDIGYMWVGIPPKEIAVCVASLGGGVLDSSEIGLGASVIETIMYVTGNRGSRDAKRMRLGSWRLKSEMREKAGWQTPLSNIQHTC
jgi:hypothetical protein